MEISASLVLCLVFATTQAAEWSYSGDKGPANWDKVSKDCGGVKQSPINIVTSEATMDSSLGSIRMTDSYSSKPTGLWSIDNNGHSVGVTVATGDYKLSQGGLGATYQLYGFHFHWGSANWQGSEHTINGKKYPLEIHYVHFNSKYGDVGTAINKTDGLAVLGFFFDIDSTDNLALQPVVDKLTEVVNAKEKVDMAPMNLMDLMGGDADDLDDFYRYSGSLTTPGCYESVTWTVFDKVLKVSNSQMAKFRSLKDIDSNAMVDNFRPTLPLHGRTVYTSKSGNSASTRSLSGFAIITSLTIVFTKIFS